MHQRIRWHSLHYCSSCTIIRLMFGVYASVVPSEAAHIVEC